MEYRNDSITLAFSNIKDAILYGDYVIPLNYNELNLETIHSNYQELSQFFPPESREKYSAYIKQIDSVLSKYFRDKEAYKEACRNRNISMPLALAAGGGSRDDFLDDSLVVEWKFQNEKRIFIDCYTADFLTSLYLSNPTFSERIDIFGIPFSENGIPPHQYFCLIDSESLFGN